MRVFLTGNEGYLGSVVQDMLLAQGHVSVGGDAGFFNPRGERAAWDIRDVTADQVRGYDAVVHLAGLSNDAAGDLSEEATVAINELSSIRLARLAKAAGVSRFVFASSCSVYGGATRPHLAEDGEVRPLTAYARSKLRAERAIVALADDQFTPVALRFATLFGFSPAFRNDLLVNRMVSTAWRYGRITVAGDGRAERPLLHVGDGASAILSTLIADEAVVGGAVFNVGVPEANYSLRTVAELVRASFPEATIAFAGSADHRTYNVCFDKFAAHVPGWRPQHTVADGVASVAQALDEGARFPRTGSQWGQGERSSWLSLLRQENVLTEGFRWRRPSAAPASPTPR